MSAAPAIKMPPEKLPPISRETESKLRQYEALLLKWQASINLIGPATLTDIHDRHFADSLQLLPLLTPADKVIFDFGAGAGFPGMVLAMADPSLKVYLFESDGRKCSFLRTVSRETGTPVTVGKSRIEDIESETQPDVITARALAPLAQLLSYSQVFAQKNTALKMLFYKGKNKDMEVAEARKLYSFELREHPSLIADNSWVLEISKLR
jgi:16S rRNA (guanine527-N7)-methyltransferase